MCVIHNLGMCVIHVIIIAVPGKDTTTVIINYTFLPIALLLKGGKKSYAVLIFPPKKNHLLCAERNAVHHSRQKDA